MGKVIIYLIILFLAIALGLALYADPGYVLIIHHNWKIGMPLWFCAVALLILFIILYVLLRLISSIKKIPKHYRNSRAKHLANQANLSLEKGIFKLAEGHFQAAENLLLQKVEYSNIPTIHYMCAAYACEQQHNNNQRDEYLYKAYSAKPNKEYAISLIQAKMQFDRKQFESALNILNRFKKTVTKQPYCLALLKDTYIQLNDWDNLSKILPQLQKYKALDSTTLDQLEIKVYAHLLLQADSLKSVQKTWKNLPKKLRDHPQIIYDYCKKLTKFEQNEEASKLASDYLNKQWYEQLVYLFGSIQTTHPEKQLKLAEDWLRKYGRDAVLLLTLGQIAAYFQHWSKAEEYIMMSLNVQKIPEAYTILGYIYEKTKRPNKALYAYREGNTRYHTQISQKHDENLES
jgi:HemY protein